MSLTGRDDVRARAAAGERVVPQGRPQIPVTARIALARSARADQGWRTDPALPALDRGLLGMLVMLEKGRWAPVEGIVAVVEEHAVEVTAAVSRMFSIGLVDVEGMTTRRPASAR